MQDLFPLNYWHWFALGLLLLIAEMAGAGGYLLWIGIAAALTGCLLYVAPVIDWQWQLLFFSIASVGCAVLWWQYQRRHLSIVDEPLLNQRSAQYVGRVFTLSDAIVNGRGKIRVDDSYWEVAAHDDLPAGTRVKVIALEHDQIFRVKQY